MYCIVLENDTVNHTILATSPVPEGAENIRNDLSEVWEDVFGSTDDKVTDNQLPQLDFVQNNERLANATASCSPILVHDIAENSETNNQLYLHAPDNNIDLTLLAIEVPSSFENSPAVSLAIYPLFRHKT